VELEEGVGPEVDEVERDSLHWVLGCTLACIGILAVVPAIEWQSRRLAQSRKLESKLASKSSNHDLMQYYMLSRCH
jgi:hypothetical protein